MPRPEHCARPVSRIYSFKERQWLAVVTECHVGVHLSRAQMGTIVHLVLDKLQALRDRLGKPLIVRSAYRSPEHNRDVGGAQRSKHMIGAASRPSAPEAFVPAFAALPSPLTRTAATTTLPLAQRPVMQ